MAEVTCSVCQQPTGLSRAEARGQVMHAECWLGVLRARWAAAPPGRQRDAVASTAMMVYKALGRQYPAEVEQPARPRGRDAATQ